MCVCVRIRVCLRACACVCGVYVLGVAFAVVIQLFLPSVIDREKQG